LPDERRVAFVGFEQSRLTLLDMNHVHGHIQLLEILAQSAMIVSSGFENDIHLRERDVATEAIDQSAKALARVLKSECWAVLKTLMAGK